MQKSVLLGTQKLFFVISEDAEFDKICLLCRQRGHSLKNCPIKNDENMDKKLCYSCGETGNSLAKCSQPHQDSSWPFSSTKNALIGFCKYDYSFLLKKIGVIWCCIRCCWKFMLEFVENILKRELQEGRATGPFGPIHPSISPGPLSSLALRAFFFYFLWGGGCKICGSVTHLAKDCPNKGSEVPPTAGKEGNTSIENEDRPRRQITKFTSGDDLDDDFRVEDSASKVQNTSNSKDMNVKSKKKQGPKVVKFVG
ncbi:hypothetical protein SLEP1_g39873 [Rubroshorea leprosula]|uniref:CCHC-type domain-containing protein n=1 Tax=Rubroshorea leprosula TaxID=152421 RepID=A0AAV5L1T9_9ROSI|nr:hypothetical protein SLEP1_g39873 [Rubroshorea leprosula]